MPAQHGTKHHAAKMTNAKVRAARKSYETGKWTIARLAEKYGVRPQTMHAIITRKTWGHVA